MKIIVMSILGFFAFIGIFKTPTMKKIEIKKEVLIEASSNEVYQFVSHLTNYPKWSPYLQDDPKQKYSVEGMDGKVGSQFHWLGSKGKDKGYQEIVSLDENRFVKVACTIEEPFEANPKFVYTFSEQNGNTLVQQNFTVESKPIQSFFMWVFGAKKEMAKMNERNLDLLKKALEEK